MLSGKGGHSLAYGDRVGAAAALERIADLALALALGETERALRLLASSQRFHAGSGIVRLPAQAKRFDSVHNSEQAALDRTVATACWDARQPTFATLFAGPSPTRTSSGAEEAGNLKAAARYVANLLNLLQQAMEEDQEADVLTPAVLGAIVPAVVVAGATLPLLLRPPGPFGA